MRTARLTMAILALCAACEAGSRDGVPAPAPDPTPAPRPTPVQQATGSVPLHGSLDPRLRVATDLGRVDGGTRLEAMSLTFTPSGTRQERQALLVALQSGGSPWYHRWLTPEQYADRFGASRADVARASAWLAQQGLEVLGPTRGRTSLAFSGTVEQLERAFHTEVHHFAFAGERHFAPWLEPSVPAELAEVVGGLRNVSDLRPAAPVHPITPDYKYGTTYELAPADWATIYDVAPLYARTPAVDGTGQKIAVAGQAAIDPTDIASFRSAFGLDPSNLPDLILVPGSGSPFVPSSSYLSEASLDLEWSGAIAKNAKIEYVYAGNAPTYSVYDAAFYAIDNAIAPVVSFSYGGCEDGYSSTEAAYLGIMGDYASMLGITLVVATGDGGAAACDAFDTAAQHGFSAGYPASMPGAVAVGGTALLAQPASKYFDVNNAAVSYIPETGWNDTSAAGYLFAGTGGTSIVFTKPYWQAGVTFNDGMRDVPDLAFAASAFDVPYVVQVGGTQVSFGGTSCGAPSFSGVLGLINHAIALATPTAPVGLGDANAILYALANDAATSAAFHDVVKGDNEVPCVQGSTDCPKSPPYRFGYTAGPGYDRVTGYGSVDVAQLVQSWTAMIPTGTQLAVATSGMTEGATLTLTATVTSSGTTDALSGDVVFYYTSPDTSRAFPDEAGMLGTVPITPTLVGGLQGATAQLVTHAPPGLSGRATVSAFYGGDTRYLASWSSVQQVTATSSFAIVPASASAPVCGAIQFSTTGGTPPVTWDFWNTYSASNGTIVIDTGAYRAGNVDGVTDTIVARDTYGAMALATVQVGPGLCPVDAGTEAGPSMDASIGPIDAAIRDTSVDWYRAPVDAEPVGAEGISIPQGEPPRPGCGCREAGRGTSWGPGGIAAMAAGLATLASRRRRKRPA